MLAIGAGVRDITPPVGTPLSGFAARAGRPSTGVHTPLNVRALALRVDGGPPHLLCSFDLVGIGPALHERVLARLESGGLSRERCLLLATHTHSGPPTQSFLGEPPIEDACLTQIEDAAGAAARDALARLAPAHLHVASARIPGLTYNRRALLADGRVSIMLEPDGEVVERGPLDDRLTVLLWRDPAEENLAAVAHFACHGVALMTQAISADIPGAVAAGLEARIGAPVLFVHGAAGDVNPTTVTAGPDDLTAWLAAFEPHLDRLNFAPAPDGEPFRAARTTAHLPYAPLPPEDAIRAERAAYEHIAGGELDAPGVGPVLTELKNMMNLPPDGPVDASLLGYLGRGLADSARRTLDAARRSSPAPQEVAAAIWRFGSAAALVCFGAEVFAATGQRIQALRAGMRLLPVSYLAPLAGYVPPDRALRLGGYEVDHAWRFYGYPAPFAAGAEPRLVAAAGALLERTD